MTDIKGKWALVTGASRGVGKLVAQSLAAQGANLILHSRKLEGTQSLAKELQGLGIQTASVAAELGDSSEVSRLIEELKAFPHPISILYNNAALMTPWRNDPWVIPDEDFRKSFESNTISLIRLCHALVPSMIERKWGRVVNVTSGIQNEPQLTAYAISKAAVDKFVNDFTPHLQKTGVQMHLMDPGWLRTDLGGPNAPNDPSSVIPGAILPVLAPDSLGTGKYFHAQDFAGLSLAEAIAKLS